MRILHCCISCFYIDNYNYQENLLPIQNLKDGNEVEIIASTISFQNNDNTKTVHIEPADYKSKEGILIRRRDYDYILSRYITDKIRKMNSFYEMVSEFDPDVILFHGTSSVEIASLIKYKKSHSKVRIYIDSHADYYTSGTNFISKIFLHGLFYRYLLTRSIPYVDKFLYVSVGCGKFMREVYKLPENKMEFFSLGGEIPSLTTIYDDRDSVIQELGIPNDTVIMLQAGKFDESKRLAEALKAFVRTRNSKIIYIVIGSFSDTVKETTIPIMSQDDRIHYLGWKTGAELNRYLNACDIYVQPGKVSASAQNAICRHCAVILNNLEEYKPFVKSNGWLIDNTESIEGIVNEIAVGNIDIDKMKNESDQIAKQFFDYKSLAKRLYA